MTDIPTITVRPSAAAAAYARVDSGTQADGGADGASSFGATLQNAMQGVMDAGNAADTKSMAALSGTGSLTDVVTAVARAQLALQTATAVRDRVVSAYQDIMKMAI